TEAYASWAARLAEYARSAELGTELGHWEGRLRDGATALPSDYEATENRAGAAATVTASLDEARTEALLGGEARRTYRCDLDDLLLAALAETLAAWTGRPTTVVNAEGHGREAIDERLDVSRTVGWFTSIAPVRLTAERSWGATVTGIKEQRRGARLRGIGFGLLRYAGPPAAREALARH